MSYTGQKSFPSSSNQNFYKSPDQKVNLSKDVLSEPYNTSLSLRKIKYINYEDLYN
jgi:hypothetical protein